MALSDHHVRFTLCCAVSRQSANSGKNEPIEGDCHSSSPPPYSSMERSDEEESNVAHALCGMTFRT